MMTIPIVGKEYKVKSFQSQDGAGYGKYLLNVPENSVADSVVLFEACYGVNFKRVSVSSTNYFIFVNDDSDITRLIICQISDNKLSQLRRFEVKGNIKFNINCNQVILNGFGYDPLPGKKFDDAKNVSYSYAISLKKYGIQTGNRVDIPRIN